MQSLMLVLVAAWLQIEQDLSLLSSLVDHDPQTFHVHQYHVELWVQMARRAES